ncbi:MAG: porin [Gammaproteobacteria bacterium]|nr:MAG: porin [Gammaproteobacteria bacterium]TLZ38105.1 MAG: porin [Gammaproteobacteria bacterium]
MKNAQITRQLLFRLFRPLVASVLLAVVALPIGAVDLKTSDGSWTFSLSGNVNVHYIYSSCQNPSSAVDTGGFGLTCVGTVSGNSVSNIGNGLLPAAFSFGVATTQDGYDLAAHLGLYPGIAANDSGSPNIGPLVNPRNTALSTTGLDIRQVYMTFGNKTMGTFTLGRNIGLFGADVILNDMTLPGVGAPGSAASSAPANTTLGGIGLGYIYTDWLAQIDYTTPEIQGFSVTGGVFDPINSLTDAGTVQPKKAPGFHAKASDTITLAGGSKLYLSVAFLSQQQYNAVGGTSYDYTGTGVDVFAKVSVQDLEAFAYYYHADGLGTTALFNGGTFGLGQTRTSDGFLVQATYKIGAVKLGVNYGESKLDFANSADQLATPTLLSKNKKGTVGAYYSLTKNLTLLGEVSRVTSDSHAGGSNDATTVNVGAFLGF